MLPRDLLSNWLLALSGWSVLVVLWHSTAVALFLGMWRVWRRAASAREQHVAALGALAAVVSLTAVTPIALMSAPPTAPAAALSDAPTAAMQGVPAGMLPSAANVASSRSSQTERVNGVMPWIGLAWFIGFVIGILRFAGDGVLHNGYGSARRPSPRQTLSRWPARSARDGNSRWCPC